MKFTAQKEELSKAIGQVGRVISTRGTLPILRNIYLETTKEGLTLKATDLEQTIEVKIDGPATELGRITVPARLLIDYLQNAADKELTLSSTDSDLLITSKNAKANFKGLPAEEYPSIPPIKAEQKFRLPSTALGQALSRCLFAAATDESRPILSGLLFRFSPQELTIVSTDGYRLALEKLSVPTQFSGDYVVPRRALMEVERLLAGEEIEVNFSASQVCFVCGSAQLISRTLDGAFPAFEAIIPKTKKFSLKLNAAQLLQGLKLVSLFSRDSAYSIKLQFSAKKLTMNATSSQFGDSTQEIELPENIDEPFTITLNAGYLIDVLTVLSGEIELICLDPHSPLVVKTPLVPNYTYLLMPLRGE